MSIFDDRICYEDATIQPSIVVALSDTVREQFAPDDAALLLDVLLGVKP